MTKEQYENLISYMFFNFMLILISVFFCYFLTAYRIKEAIRPEPQPTIVEPNWEPVPQRQYENSNNQRLI